MPAGSSLATRSAGPKCVMRPVRHGDDGVGLVDHRLFEAVAERIAGEGKDGAADGGRAGRRVADISADVEEPVIKVQ